MFEVATVVLNARFKSLSSGMCKTATKAAPLLMPLFLRGAAMGASRLGNERMILDYGKQLADRGIDPYDLPGKRADTWIDPTMTYGMGLGLTAHVLNSYLGKKDEQGNLSSVPLYAGSALGGLYGAYKTYKGQSEVARDVLTGAKTRDTDLVNAKDYIRDKLKELDKKKK